MKFVFLMKLTWLSRYKCLCMTLEYLVVLPAMDLLQQYFEFSLHVFYLNSHILFCIKNKISHKNANFCLYFKYFTNILIIH